MLFDIALYAVWNLKSVYDFGFDKSKFKFRFLNCDASNGMINDVHK